MFSLRLFAVLLAITPASVWSLNCPDMPSQTNKDWSAEVEAAVGRLGPVKAAEMGVRAKAVTRDLLGKLPNADVVYLEQMMYATFCSALKGSNLSEEEKANRLLKASSGVRDAIRARTPGFGPPSHAPAASKPTSRPRVTAEVPVSRFATKAPEVGTTAAVYQNGQWVIVRDGAVVPAQATVHPSAALPTDASNSAVPVEQWLDSTIVLRGKFSEYFGYGSKRPTIVHQWQGEVSWREIFRVMSPYLVESLRQDELAKKVARRIIVPSQPLEGSCEWQELNEADWERIFVQFRSQGLISIRKVDFNDGSKRAFVDETDKGNKLMNQIIVVKGK